MKTALNGAVVLMLCAFLLAGNARAQTEAGPAPGSATMTSASVSLERQAVFSSPGQESPCTPSTRYPCLNNSRTPVVRRRA